MSTNLPAVAPEYIKALMANDPAMQALFDEMTSGISTGMPPTIVAYSGQFIQKEGGIETIVRYPETQSSGQPHPAAGEPVSVISVVALRAKEGLEKAYYATAYTPGQETQAPDCFSLDGIKPDPSCSDKQCESCAGCPQNMFGTGTNQDGTPGKGKACADRKVLAIFANSAVWRFAIPPASLQTWVAYANSLKAHGVLPIAVITKIGFDPQDKYKLTFTFAGMLTEEQLPKIIEMAKTDEVMAIVGKKTAAIENKGNVADLAEEKAKKEAEAKAKKEAEVKEKKEADAKTKKEAAAAAKKPAAEVQGALDLGLGTETVIETTAVQTVEADDIIARLGL